MIGRLTGTVLDCQPGRLLLDVAGVGYDVQIPLSTFYRIVSGDGTDVRVHVHTHVREDALQLFGFFTLEERALFEQLISISGVGPRLALSILSGIGVDELHQAVAGGDRARIQKIPGVGKKTAERVLLELRDKLKIDGDQAPPVGEDSGSTIPAPVRADAISALVNLGYSQSVADRAVDKALTAAPGDPDLEELLKRALSGLVG